MRPTRWLPAAIHRIAIIVLIVGGCAGAEPASTPAGGDPDATASPSARPAATQRPATSVRPLPECREPRDLGCLAEAVQVAGLEGRFAGVVLVAKDGRAVWDGAYGESQARGLYSLETRFNVASVGKMFTAVAVAQLEADGQVGLDDPISRYVEDLSEDAGRATLGQLLSHTSGLPRDGPAELAFAPGEFNYSNLGFNLAARAVEEAADTAFSSYLRAEVFGPAEMMATGWDVDPPRGAPHGAGGLFSTTPDLLRFGNALLGRALLPTASVDTITTPKVVTPDFAYGYGFGIWATAEEAPTIGHAGALPDIVAVVEINPTMGWTVVVLMDRGWSEIRDHVNVFMAANGMGHFPG